MQKTFYNRNSAKNAAKLTINDVDFYFSYSTIVGVSYNGNTYVHTNVWGATTGKHLNWIDEGNKDSRLDTTDFKNKLEEAMKIAGINEQPTV